MSLISFHFLNAASSSVALRPSLKFSLGRIFEFVCVTIKFLGRMIIACKVIILDAILCQSLGANALEKDKSTPLLTGYK